MQAAPANTNNREEDYRERCYRLENELADLRFKRDREKSDSELEISRLRNELNLDRERFESEIGRHREIEEALREQIFSDGRKLAEVCEAAEVLITRQEALKKELENERVQADKDYERWEANALSNARLVEALQVDVGALESDLEIAEEQRRGELQKRKQLEEEMLQEKAAYDSLCGEVDARDEEVGSLREQQAILEQRLKAELVRADHRVRSARQAFATELAPAFQMIRYARDCDTHGEAKKLFSRALMQFEKLAPLPSAAGGDEPLTAKKAATFLHVSKKTLRSIPASELPYELVGSGERKAHRRYRTKELIAYQSRRD